MRSANLIIIAAAGGGKTTRVVGQALGADTGITALVTYTRNNVREIGLKMHERLRAIPPHVEVISWYTFLLHELARPYQSAMHAPRIDGICWTEERSAIYAPEANTRAHYFSDSHLIYSDKISKFICACDAKSGGSVMRRLRQRFAHIIIDEIQDMAGYDLDLLELMLRSNVRVTFVGDHRQATFATNNAPKNKAFRGPAIIQKFEAWSKAGLVSIVYENETYRCNQALANLGDSFFPNEPKTKSLNFTTTGHDGVFLVKSADVEAYIHQFAPQVLRYSAATSCNAVMVMNFGESKGLTFDRVLIYPHGLATKWLKTGNLAHVAKSAAKMYVASTRARYSAAFVYDGATCAIPATRWIAAP